jgi:hypothetical protein
MPRNLRRDLPDFFVQTVQEAGWAGRENGNLLRSASGAFDVLLTADQRLRYQQNIAQFAIGIVVIETSDTTLPNLRRSLDGMRSHRSRLAASLSSPPADSPPHHLAQMRFELAGRQRV